MWSPTLVLIAAWGDPNARPALLVALVSHAAMRVWSLVEFVLTTLIAT